MSSRCSFPGSSPSWAGIAEAAGVAERREKVNPAGLFTSGRNPREEGPRFARPPAGQVFCLDRPLRAHTAGRDVPSAIPSRQSLRSVCGFCLSSPRPPSTHRPTKEVPRRRGLRNPRMPGGFAANLTLTARPFLRTD